MTEPSPAATTATATSSEEPSLGPAGKVLYSTGDFTLNTVLSSLGLVYTSFFLTQVAGVRPALAGLIPLIGRFVDAFTDPLMGYISDHTTWRLGRRRPWFLIGAVPYGISFALLWITPPLDGQVGRFAYYVGIYCLVSVTMTILSIPYLAILPEMATGYDQRTSLNTYRSVGSLFGVMAAVSTRPLADALGGGAAGYASAGAVLGVVVALPWLAVFGVTFERPAFQQRRTQLGFAEGARLVFRHGSFVRLTTIYLVGRIAMDLVSTLIILYMTFYIGRSGDFELVMMLFVGTVVLALPAWQRVARGREKPRVFALGSVWWILAGATLFFVQPDWPRWLIFILVPMVGIGFAVVDLMPWSMLGEVIDEDDLTHGERREGLYNGFFMFVRKLGGALGVALVMGILDLAGFAQGEEQTETARQTIRVLTAFSPAVFLAIGVWIALDYPLTRDRHEQIQERLASRDGQPPDPT